MIRIIDRTLTAIDKEKDTEGQLLYQMCELLIKLGISYIEVSVPVLKKMGHLPEGGHFFLKMEQLKEKALYPNFEAYIWEEKKEKSSLGELFYEVQASSIEEADEKIKEKKINIEEGILRLTGFEDMIFRDYQKEITIMVKRFTKNMDFCPSDKRYCATAMAMEWLLSGGKSVSVSFNGVGGFAKLEEVLMGIRIIMNKKIKMNLNILPEICRLYEKIMEVHVSYNKAVIGKNIFNLEAGVRNGSSHHPELTYEPYDPVIVGKKRRLVIGKYSGENAVKLKLKEAGLEGNEKMVQEMIGCIRELTMKLGRSLTDREFVHLAKEMRSHGI